jgi:HAD superfamily hydrolase (TIGR01549 family)
MRAGAEASLSEIEGISLDFYETLAFHREGGGRARALVDYLDAHELAHAPWEHQVLYDVFDQHDARYAPGGSPADRMAYYVFLADRIFKRLQVPTAEGDAERHARNLWRILGPQCFDVFPDAWTALSALRARGYSIAIVSNWQAGLRHFCAELGLAGHVDHVVASGDVGVAKPDPGIFEEACARLGMRPERVLHVGDSLVDDYRGGAAAGLQVILLQRDPEPEPQASRIIHRLDELPELL